MKIEKIIKGAIWFSLFILTIGICSIFLYIGFNNYRKGNITVLIIGFSLLPLIFYCAFKGLKLIISAIFDSL